MGRNKTGLLSVLILAVLVLALLFSFGRSLFLKTAEVRLPSAETGQGTGTGTASGTTAAATSYLPVVVDRNTVQAVISSLSRPQSYNRRIDVETYWDDGGYGLTKVFVWVSGGYTRTRTELPGGGIRNAIAGEGRYYLWYDGDKDYFAYDAPERASDAAQQIPTYEDVLDLPAERILDAGYEKRSEIDCVYVEVSEDSLGYRERYWVSVETGLLVCSETEKDGRVVYRMSSFAVDIPAVGEGRFTLPDGTDLLD